MTEDGPAEWMARHQDVRLRPVEEADLGYLGRFSTEPELSEPFEWRGFRDPNEHRRRWEQDSYLGKEDALLIVALPDGAFTGLIVWHLLPSHGPRVVYRIGILLYPEFRGRGLGFSVQCLLADYLFSTTLAERVEAGTDVENVAEQKALEKAGFQREGRLRGGGYGRGRMHDGFLYARIRSDPHP